MKNPLFRSITLSALMFGSALAAPTKPHMVFILADDLGWTQIGKRAGVSNLQNDYASGHYLTPQINRLAEMGMTFNRAYACPNCAPTRASLMTGEASSRHGVSAVFDRGGLGTADVKLSSNETQMAASFQTLAETLKSAGYATGHFGKWHIGPYNTLNSVQNQGFDINVAGAGTEHSSLSEGGLFHADAAGQWTNGDFIKPPKVENGTTNTFTRTPGEHMTDALTDEAHNWMAAQVAANPDTPVFVYLAHHATHSPIDPLVSDEAAIPATSTDPRHTRQAFGGLLYGLDRSVGTMLDYLENNNDDQGNPLIDNTVFIFMGDNGGEDNNLTGRMAPLRGAKGSQFEGGVRVPCFISTPAMRAAGQTDTATDQAIQVQDFHATLAALAGASAPTNLDGVDFSQVLTNPGNTFSRDIFDWWTQQRTGVGEAHATLHRGNMKLIWYPFEAFNPDITARFDLFDVVNDLSESADLSGDPAHRTLLYEMAETIGTKLATDGTPLPYHAATLVEVPLPSVLYAYDDSANASYGGATVINVLANDFDPELDPATVVLVDTPTNGVATVDPLTGSITYTHGGVDANPDHFSYTVQNTSGETSNVAAVEITVLVGWDGETGNDLGTAVNWAPDTAPDATGSFIVTTNAGFTGVNQNTVKLTSGNTSFGYLDFAAAGTDGNLTITSGTAFGRLLMNGDLVFSGDKLTGTITLNQDATSLSYAAEGGNREIVNRSPATVFFGDSATFGFHGWNSSTRQLKFNGSGDFVVGPNATFNSTTAGTLRRLTLIGTAPVFTGTLTIQSGTVFSTGGGAGLRVDGGTIRVIGTDTIAGDEQVGFGASDSLAVIRELDLSGTVQTNNTLAALAAFAAAGINQLRVDSGTRLVFSDLRIPTGNRPINIMGWAEGNTSLVFNDLGGTFYPGTVAEGATFIDLTVEGAPAYMTSVPGGWKVTAGQIDGVPLSWIYEHFGTLDGFSGSDDPDDDVFDNLSEYLADTDPNTNSSVLTMLGVSATPSNTAVTYQNGGTNADVVVEHRTGLDVLWVPVNTNQGPTNPTNTYIHDYIANTSFYRVSAERND